MFKIIPPPARSLVFPRGCRLLKDKVESAPGFPLWGLCDSNGWAGARVSNLDLRRLKSARILSEAQRLLTAG